MTYVPRWYQTESAEALANAISINRQVHPIAVLPTGSGKTFTICETINLKLTRSPESKVLVLSHVAEILMQNHAALSSFFEGVEIGLYSASCKSRTINKITVAGIQSVHNKPELFEGFDLIIIDECHLVPIDAETMYRSFLGKMDANCVGLTATPYRMKHGYIYKGKGALFNCLAYDLSTMDQYNRLVEEGFLSAMYGKGTDQTLDAKDQGIKLKGGDFDLKEMSMAFDRESITRAAIKEVCRFGKDRVLWLFFAIDIKHAENIAEILREGGRRVACVHSKMDGNRADIISDIKAMKYDAVVNVDVLTTGFDAPRIDLIADLRPTQSASLHVQKLGRGARVHPKKRNCLVLDFAGNIERLGPINNVIVKEKGEKGAGNGEPIMKKCPECGLLAHPSEKICIQCSHEFMFKEKIIGTASSAAAQVTELTRWLEVKSIVYSIHQKPGSPSSLRVQYKTGFTSFSEWICFDHKGFAGHKAKNWVQWRWRSGAFPESVGELKRGAKDSLRVPKRIKIDTSSKYPSITDYDFQGAS